MAKSKLLIALLVIFILPVFIGSYNKYSKQNYNEMNYSEIGKEYTDYFSEGIGEISIIADIGELSIKVIDYITDAVDWIMEAIDWIMDGLKKIFNIDSNSNNNGSLIPRPEDIIPEIGGGHV